MMFCWYAHPQLFFKCHLRPKHGRLPKNRTCKAIVCTVFNNFLLDDLFRELVFFNTFEGLHLPIKGAMEDARVIKLSNHPQIHVSMWLLLRTW